MKQIYLDNGADAGIGVCRGAFPPGHPVPAHAPSPVNPIRSNTDLHRLARPL